MQSIFRRLKRTVVTVEYTKQEEECKDRLFFIIKNSVMVGKGDKLNTERCTRERGVAVGHESGEKGGGGGISRRATAPGASDPSDATGSRVASDHNLCNNESSTCPAWRE